MVFRPLSYRWLFVVPAALLVLGVLDGCSQASLRRQAEERQILNQLQLIEILLPLPPDSILARYRDYDSVSFYQQHFSALLTAAQLIDSLNHGFPDTLQIDTVAIDHSLERFGEAARHRKTLMLSSAYFVVYDDAAILRSVVVHEFGHLAYDTLSSSARSRFDSLWTEAGRRGLFYLFHDAEYSGNTRFGGHPEDSPTELYASAHNLLYNRPEEFRSRLRYVDDRALNTVQSISAIVVPSFLIRP